ncbi:hypothetical protein B0H13DRAFT_1895573 [Mycena leptocephala]|nr:hypothetical protein B0H13DRAFT_1895573 [Mycena leptocephala]
MGENNSPGKGAGGIISRSHGNWDNHTAEVVSCISFHTSTTSGGVGPANGTDFASGPTFGQRPFCSSMGPRGSRFNYSRPNHSAPVDPTKTRLVPSFVTASAPSTRVFHVRHSAETDSDWLLR